MADKRSQWQSEIFETQVYDQLWEQDRQAKLQREAREAKKRESEKQSMLDILYFQNEQKSQMESADDIRKRQEQSMLQSQWRLEDERAVEMKTEQRLINKERNLEIIKHNELERQIKEAEYQKELN